MSRDHLSAAHRNSLAKNEQPTRRTTLSIILGDGQALDLSTADVEFGDKIYLGKLAPVDALNMELTGATEGIKFLVNNKNLALGHNLINTPNVLDGLTAIVGLLVFEGETGEEFHDEKITGKIEIGDIDGDFVQVNFSSLTAASIYHGELISEAFPDEEVPPAEIPAPITPVYPVYDDLPPVEYGSYSNLQDKFGSRYRLPERLETYILY